MILFGHLVLLVCFLITGALQNLMEVIQERFTVDYYNPKLTLFDGRIYKYNRTTKSLTFTLAMYIDLTDHDLVAFKGYKLRSNEYRLDIVQFEHPIKDLLTMKFFGIDQLVRNLTKPPLEWPVRRNIAYKIENWTPESTLFPPGLPEGRWKMTLSWLFANKTPFAITSWYGEVSFKGYKWMSNEYRLDILQFEHPIKDLLTMKFFGIHELVRNLTNPPLEWPVRKNVSYKLENWIVDSNQFPPGLPEGRWKITLSFSLANKTSFAVISWYGEVKYKIPMFG
ncbi:hypothetical protein FQA39_LY16199 [Lamprigera yunnana]|nr:hypothetical protein FQA39_LY16199 [Lamprigera yunnana]